MKTSHSDQLDLLFTLATADCVTELNEEFRAAQSNLVVSAPTHRRIWKMIRRENRRTTPSTARTVFKYVLLSILLAATVAFTACMALPRVREAIWKVMLDWQEDHIHINFVPNEPSKPSANTPTNPPSPSIPQPPESIEDARFPQYFPEGYTVEVKGLLHIFAVDYYDPDGAFMITYHQTTQDMREEVDNTGATVTELTINGCTGLFISYAEEENVYYLVWQDTQYRYSIYGYFANVDDLFRMANSVVIS